MTNRLKRHAKSLLKMLASRTTLAGTEDLHDFRVALRSWRVLYSLTERRGRRWQKIAKASNAPRDLEVQLALARQFFDSEPLASSWLAGMQAEHDAAQARFIGQLAKHRKRLWRKARLQGINQRSHRRHEQQARAQLLAELTALGLNSPARQWHVLRLTIKRLRYLQEAAGKKPDLLRKAQNALGELHDLDVLLASLPADLPRDAVETQRQQAQAIAAATIAPLAKLMA